MTDALSENVERVRSATPTPHPRRPYRRLRMLATAQHGLVARWQLARLGMTDSTIAGWVASERLVRVRRGVYAVGCRDARDRQRWLAAVLAVGPGATLSHDDALALHGRRPAQSARRVHVTTGRRGARDRRGIRVHPVRQLDTADLTVVDGIPVTTLARSIFDAAAVSTRAEVVADLDAALSRDLVGHAALDAVVRRAHGRGGRGRARFASARAEVDRLGAHLTRSQVEQRIVAICDRHGLPLPVMNHTADGYEIDIAFVGPRVGVEIDSFLFHGDRRSFVRDRRKIRRLQQAGWRMLSFAAVDLADDESGFARELVAALEQRASSPRA